MKAMSFVYIIQHGSRGPYKIGKADNPQTRLKELQIGNPVELRLVASIYFQTENRARAVERQLHRMYSRARIRGEWFRQDIELKRADDFFKLDSDSLVSFYGQQEFIEEDLESELEILNEARKRI